MRSLIGVSHTGQLWFVSMLFKKKKNKKIYLKNFIILTIAVVATKPGVTGDMIIVVG